MTRCGWSTRSCGWAASMPSSASATTSCGSLRTFFIGGPPRGSARTRPRARLRRTYPGPPSVDNDRPPGHAARGARSRAPLAGEGLAGPRHPQDLPRVAGQQTGRVAEHVQLAVVVLGEAVDGDAGVVHRFHAATVVDEQPTQRLGEAARVVTEDVVTAQRP